MLQRKHSIKIEVTAERKIVELSSISTEDALKLIVAADSIRVSHAKNTEVSDTDSPLNNPAN
jgi:hypothetical protein